MFSFVRKQFAPEGSEFGTHVVLVFLVVIPRVCHEDSEKSNENFSSDDDDEQHEDNGVVSENKYDSS